MLLKVVYLILVACVCMQISVGQNSDLDNDHAFSTRVSNPDTGISSIQQISSTITQTPIEAFVTEFNSSVYTSDILPIIFDLSGFSPEYYSRSMYGYVLACGIEVGHTNPHELASAVANPLKEGIETYTLPLLLDIYANAIAKYLFAKGTLSSSSASSLARKYAKIVEENAKRTWIKEFPDAKIHVLTESFVEFMRSVDNFSLNTIDDLAVYFANEVKRNAKKL